MESYPRDEAFAVIRLDPVASVRHLRDPEALRAAQALTPQTYIVYLFESCPLPIWGERPWHAFNIYPVGSSLRLANEDECITPEMCTPIRPNEVHPDGREALGTRSAFPFDNCYLWSGAKLAIRAIPRTEGFNWDHAIDLWPGTEYNRWLDLEEDDRMRQLSAQFARQPQSGPSSDLCAPIPVSQPPNNGVCASTPHAKDSTLQGRELLPNPVLDSCTPTSVEQRPPNPITQPHDIEGSADSESAYSESLIASMDAPARGTDASGSVDTFTVLKRLFSDPQNSPELQPLCHLWFNLAEHTKQDEIPDPVHLFEERDAIVRIIREARARNPNLPPLPIPTGSSTSLHSCNQEEARKLQPLDEKSPESAAELARRWREERKSETRRKCFRPLRLVRKVACRIRSIFRIPCVPRWP